MEKINKKEEKERKKLETVQKDPLRSDITLNKCSVHSAEREASHFLQSELNLITLVLFSKSGEGISCRELFVLVLFRLTEYLDS